MLHFKLKVVNIFLVKYTDIENKWLRGECTEKTCTVVSAW